MKQWILLVGACLYVASSGHSAHTGDDTQTMLNLVNQARARGATCGGQHYGSAPPVKRSARLDRTARRWAQYMLRTGKFAHSLDGSTFVKRIFSVCGPTPVAENLSGNRSARDAVQRLLRSPGHCRNIMNPSYRYIGIGKAAGGRYGAYWVQNFAGRC